MSSLRTCDTESAVTTPVRNMTDQELFEVLRMLVIQQGTPRVVDALHEFRGRFNATLQPDPLREEIARETLAETIHKARWPLDRVIHITPFADEYRNGREYCFRIADAILALLHREGEP